MKASCVSVYLVQDEGGGLHVLLHGGKHEHLAEDLPAEHQRFHLRKEANLCRAAAEKVG